MKANAARKQREQATRRYALEPIRLALKSEGRTMTWLMGRLTERGGIQVKRSALYSYLSGQVRVRREFVARACLIAGANPGDVYARIAGQESVLFQPDKR